MCTFRYYIFYTFEKITNKTTCNWKFLCRNIFKFLFYNFIYLYKSLKYLFLLVSPFINCISHMFIYLDLKYFQIMLLWLLLMSEESILLFYLYLILIICFLSLFLINFGRNLSYRFCSFSLLSLAFYIIYFSFLSVLLYSLYIIWI